MSLEKGGRSDKIGNTYENRYLAKLLLRLVEEEYFSIEVEPLGSDSIGAEYIITYADGSKHYYQCKASNADNSKWSFSDLKSRKIFDNARTHIDASDNYFFHFISPLPYDEIDSLCERARTNHSPNDFITFQQTNPKLISNLNSFESHYGLSRNNPLELARLVNILSHCYFELVPRTRDYLEDLNARVSTCFVGNAESIRVILENCVNDNEWYGKPLTSKVIVDYMESKGYLARNYGADSRILPRVRELNTTFWGQYTPINGAIFPRKASKLAAEYLKEGKSVILHGRAGVGKSGCAEEITSILEKDQVVYLRIKLDKFIPASCADEFGHSLGLPESPAYCLHKLSGGEPCVLILDQLDCLRWTTAHSATALAVCKEIINQARIINRNENGKLSILFITRSFDYKHDSGIRELFVSDDESKQEWAALELNLLTDEETQIIVGKTYTALTSRLRKLLRTPANLYVWTQLNPIDRNNSIRSVNELMHKWMNKILNNCEHADIRRNEIDSFLKALSGKMNSLGKFSLSKRLFLPNEKEIQLLISNGLLNENTNMLSFVHQSFLDYFLASEFLNDIVSGKSILSLIGGRDKQTPNLRYRFLSVLQGLMEEDADLYIQECRSIIQSEEIRFYYKCAVFEIIAQCTDIDVKIITFVKEYYEQIEWHDYVRQTVFYGHPEFIKALAQNNSFEWLSIEGMWYLKSINEVDPTFVVTVLETYLCDDPNIIRKLYECLCFEVSSDSDCMYEFRLKLFKLLPDLICDGHHAYYNAFNQSPERCIDFLKLALENHSLSSTNSIHLPSDNILMMFAKENSNTIVSSLLPILFKVTNGMVSKIKNITYTDEYDKWTNHRFQEGFLRKVLEIVKWSLESVCDTDMHKVLAIANDPAHTDVLVRNELLLTSFQSASTVYADDIISWLISDFPLNLFDYTSNTADLLSSAKKVISKHSSHCRTELFLALENLICRWNEDPKHMIRTYKYRIETNRTKTHKPIYNAYWGHLQKELLPCLSAHRTSIYTKRLIGVTERNLWIYENHFHTKPNYDSGGLVVSPLQSQASRISDKTWLNIIANSLDEKTHSTHFREDCVIETTPYAFASDLSSVAKKDPERFARLALLFPQNTDMQYVSAILRSLCQNQDPVIHVDINLVCDVIRHFWRENCEELSKSISRIVENRAEEKWPNDILELIGKIALTPQKPYYNSGKEKTCAHELYNAMLNQPRGCALCAIQKLIKHHPELWDYYKNILIRASEDESDSVRFSVVECLAPYLNVDSEFCCKLFRKLLALDLRFFISQFAWYYVSKDYQNAPGFYQELLCLACESEITDLSEQAARIACALAIYRKDEFLQEYILTANHSSAAVSKFIQQAVHSFNDEVYHNISSYILLNLANRFECRMEHLGYSFFTEKVDFSRDADFLIGLLQSKSKLSLIHRFLKYLNDIDKDISIFVNLLKEICSELPNVKEKYRQQTMVNHMIQCIIRIFDRSKDDPHICCICLDIWDEIFRGNLDRIKSLGELIDDFD